VKIPKQAGGVDTVKISSGGHGRTVPGGRVATFLGSRAVEICRGGAVCHGAPAFD
jgi:hypothetical protein